MSEMAQSVDEARCGVCQVRSALQERLRLTEHLQAQADLSALLVEEICGLTTDAEAKRLLMLAASEIRRCFGQGGI